MRTLSALAIAFVIAPTAALGQNLDTLRSELDAAKRSIQTLEQRIQSLEAEKARTAAAPVVVAPSLGTGAAAPEPDKARLEIYGFAQLDAIYDFDRVDPNWKATLRPSKIPVNCPGDAGCGKDGDFTASVRQSRLGARGFLPTDLGTLSTKFEFDLFGVGSDEGKTTMRIRHVYGELGQVLAGQTNSLFMDGDVFPNTIDYWGPAGMIFVRNPQVRWTPWKREGTQFAVGIEAPSANLDAGNAAAIDPSLANVSSHTKYPDITAQIKSQQSWGHVQLAALGKVVGFDNPAGPDAEPSNEKLGYGVNLSGSIKTWGKDKILAQVAYGEGISGYINDCCVDLAPSSSLQAETVPLLGWLLYYDHYWSDRWSSSIGYSETHQDNTGGQLGNAFNTGRYASVNLLWTPVKNVLTGVELLWGERENKDGNNGSDTRVQFSAKYDF
jgi:hypothetical protein